MSKRLAESSAINEIKNTKKGICTFTEIHAAYMQTHLLKAGFKNIAEITILEVKLQNLGLATNKFEFRFSSELHLRFT